MINITFTVTFFKKGVFYWSISDQVIFISDEDLFQEIGQHDATLEMIGLGKCKPEDQGKKHKHSPDREISSDGQNGKFYIIFQSSSIK